MERCGPRRELNVEEEDSWSYATLVDKEQKMAELHVENNGVIEKYI